jgi:hypothetical protein
MTDMEGDPVTVPWGQQNPLHSRVLAASADFPTEFPWDDFDWVDDSTNARGMSKVLKDVFVVMDAIDGSKWTAALQQLVDDEKFEHVTWISTCPFPMVFIQGRPYVAASHDTGSVIDGKPVGMTIEPVIAIKAAFGAETNASGAEEAPPPSKTPQKMTNAVVVGNESDEHLKAEIIRLAKLAPGSLKYISLPIPEKPNPLATDMLLVSVEVATATMANEKMQTTPTIHPPSPREPSLEDAASNPPNDNGPPPELIVPPTAPKVVDAFGYFTDTVKSSEAVSKNLSLFSRFANLPGGSNNNAPKSSLDDLAPHPPNHSHSGSGRAMRKKLGRVDTSSQRKSVLSGIHESQSSFMVSRAITGSMAVDAPPPQDPPIPVYVPHDFATHAVATIETLNRFGFSFERCPLFDFSYAVWVAQLSDFMSRVQNQVEWARKEKGCVVVAVHQASSMFFVVVTALVALVGQGDAPFCDGRTNNSVDSAPNTWNVWGFCDRFVERLRQYYPEVPETMSRDIREIIAKCGARRALLDEFIKNVECCDGARLKKLQMARRASRAGERILWAVLVKTFLLHRGKTTSVQQTFLQWMRRDNHVDILRYVANFDVWEECPEKGPGGGYQVATAGYGRWESNLCVYAAQ